MDDKCKEIVEFNYRTGKHVHRSGEIWDVYDGPRFDGTYMNYEGKKISAPRALYDAQRVGSLRKWRMSDEAFERNLADVVARLRKEYQSGFDPDGEITSVALAAGTWAKSSWYDKAFDAIAAAHDEVFGA